MTLIQFPPAVDQDHRELPWRYELPKPTAGPALRRWQIESQLSDLLAAHPYVEAVRFFADMTKLDACVAAELVDALLDAGDAVLATEAEGPRDLYYAAVDEYAEALWAIDRATRPAVQAELDRAVAR